MWSQPRGWSERGLNGPAKEWRTRREDPCNTHPNVWGKGTSPAARSAVETLFYKAPTSGTSQLDQSRETDHDSCGFSRDFTETLPIYPTTPTLMDQISEDLAIHDASGSLAAEGP
jgi:hypothetical protein